MSLITPKLWTSHNATRPRKIDCETIVTGWILQYFSWWINWSWWVKLWECPFNIHKWPITSMLIRNNAYFICSLTLVYFSSQVWFCWPSGDSSGGCWTAVEGLKAGGRHQVPSFLWKHDYPWFCAGLVQSSAPRGQEEAVQALWGGLQAFWLQKACWIAGWDEIIIWATSLFLRQPWA